MKINGIGIIKKEQAMSILTKEGRQAVQSGDITLDELGQMYKLEMVKRSSKIGDMPDTFRQCYKWIPDKLKDELTPADLANLTDEFYDCYSNGKAGK